MIDRPNDRVDPLSGYAPAVGAALWRLEDTRSRTLALVSDVHPALVDWPPPWNGNTIGSLLYHVAAIELDWLFYDILQSEDYPDTVATLFPVDVREDGGKLTPVTGYAIDEHVARMARVRAMVLSRLRGMTEDDFRTTRATDSYDVTPEWVLHHLGQHEAEHRGQIGEVLQAAALRAS
jgi:uncharacterized damage-inducible protein DinB